ncbi:auxin efflux carrier family protein [Striga asiatica]|uniref:Auxin efflux carrier family protein n=1 Tax=Striga asiatica TaxID=4170 RepID=A0A5A7Q352_STRAF|nr:auxin efflux carrier family protein [Striga asiatica]
MGLLDLFIASTIPVVKVLLVTGLGSYLALDHVSILVQDARKHLNNITFFVFNPALVSSNLAKTITYDSMVKMWFMPFNILFTFIIGSIFGNLGNLPLIIIPAVCKERASPFGDPDVCRTNGMGYASLSMAIGAIYLWSYVYNVVRVSTINSMEVEIVDSPVSKSRREGSSAGSASNGAREPLLDSSDEESEIILTLPPDRFGNRLQVSFLDKVKECLEKLFKKMNLKKLFAPSTTGAIVGFAVGLVPQIRQLLIGDAAPLRVLQDTALFLGDAAVPSITLIVGGNLLKGLKGTTIQKSIIFGILGVRYVVMPLLGIVIVKGAVRFGFVHDDPLYQFVLLLQFSLPPAMNIGTITQLFGMGENECSVIMLWCYSVASVALTLWSTYFLWLVS